MSWLILAAVISLDGTVCRMNRAVDRVIIRSDNGPRVRVNLDDDVSLVYAKHTYDREDLRPGDRVHVTARRGSDGLDAKNIDVTMRVDDQLIDSFFRSRRPVTGRFAVREAKTELFSMHLPNRRYIRVDAKSAYGPDGRVRVGSLKSGDLLEVRGAWQSKDLLQASSITVLTNQEPSFCTTAARRGEMSAETAAREAQEQRFLDKIDGN